MERNKKPNVVIVGHVIYNMVESQFYLQQLQREIDKGNAAMVIGLESNEEVMQERLKNMKLPEPVIVKPNPISEYQEVLPLPENKDYINGGKKLPHKRKRR